MHSDEELKLVKKLGELPFDRRVLRRWRRKERNYILVWQLDKHKSLNEDDLIYDELISTYVEEKDPQGRLYWKLALLSYRLNEKHTNLFGLARELLAERHREYL